MADNNLSFVRTEMLQGQTPPLGERGIVRWIRINLMATPVDAALTVFALFLLVWFVPPMINWLFVQASWSGVDRAVCATVSQGGTQPEGWSGACWAYVNANFNQFMYGRYPQDQHWRVNIVGVMFVVLLVPLLIPRIPFKSANAIVFFFVFPIVAFFLLVGGWFGLPYIETATWGGLLVTLVLSFVGISVSLPLGIVLALGRRSKMPIIKMLCVVFIEMVRGIPLVTVLFMASYMLPLFLPPGVTFDKFLRALIGVALFASAYMAEVVRGGLQAIPKGQYEGADSLGLSYWQK
ncbi:MAG: ABC transporter permease subunit, partial [Phyllobacterium sp.]|nr:ABC transporter permease subunit [Phyllobacterium sp.]